MIIKNLKKFSLLAFFFILAQFKLFAQKTEKPDDYYYVVPFGTNDEFRTWSVGISAGGLSQYTVFMGSNDFKTVKPQAGYGINVTKQFVPSFAMQADFFGGTLQGQYAAAAIGQSSPYSKFSTGINVAGSISANLTIANINWRKSEAYVQPYATVGGGFMNYKPSLTDYTSTTMTQLSSTNFFIPVGVGLKLGVSRNVALDLGYIVAFVNATNVDGYKYTGNNDKFSYTHIGLEFSIGDRSKPRLVTHNVQSVMHTEYVYGIKSLQTLVKSLQAQTDSISAKNNALIAKNEVLASTIEKTTIDSDGDGVADQFDKCPNTPPGTKVDGAGCPLPPSEIKYVYVTAADKEVVHDVIQTLEFDLMKSSIKATSYTNLDKLAGMLKQRGIKLKLDGYTDNTGPDWRNLAISKSRAIAIKNYLIKKGAISTNIIAEGHGNENPIASNETLEGRRQNRRVDFTLQNGIAKQ